MNTATAANTSQEELQREALTVGIDVGDTHSNLCVLDAEGNVTEETKVRTTPAVLRRQLERFPSCRVVIEVGSQSPWLSRLIRECGHVGIVANPVKVRLIAQSNQKTDRSDAETLARLGRIDPQLLSPVAHRSAQQQADLAVIRSRKALVGARALLINQVRGTVKAVGARLPACDAAYFARRAAGQIPEELDVALKPLITSIAHLTSEIKAADAQIETLIAERYPAAKGLQQVPGAGPLISLTFVLTLGDPDRFPKSRAVGPYLGLTPRQRASGKRAPQLGISKAGDSYLRHLLVQGAHCILRQRGPTSDLKLWGLERVGGGGKNAKKRAVVAVARKLAVLLHHLWATGEVYEPLRNHPAVQREGRHRTAKPRPG
jgi:transposase